MIASGVVHVPRPAKSGWTVDMVVVHDAQGARGALVYSPVLHGDRTRELAGTPRVLVAPNHYHHVALPRYRELYPDAAVVTSDGARPRLAKKGHTNVRALGDVELPEGVRLLAAEGVKNGETWMVVERDEKVLAVADAFFNVDAACTGFEGFMLRRLRTVGGLRLGRTFQWVGIGDKSAYRKWAIDTLTREKPTVIAFAHGAPLRGGDAWKQCVELVEMYVK